MIAAFVCGNLLVYIFIIKLKKIITFVVAIFVTANLMATTVVITNTELAMESLEHATIQNIHFYTTTNTTQKIFVNGQVRILKAASVYSIQGQLLK